MKPEEQQLVVLLILATLGVWLVGIACYRAGFRPFGPRRHRAVPWTAAEVMPGVVPLVIAGIWRGLLSDEQAEQNEWLGALSLAAYFLIILLPLVIVFVAGGRPYQMGLHGDRWRRNLVLGLLSFVLIAPPVALTNLLAIQLFERRPHEIVQLLEESPTVQNMIASGFAAVIVAPFLEELTFRGILLPWLRRHIGPWPAIVGSSLLFAIAHLDAWPAPIALFVLAMSLGFLAYRTTSLVAPVVLHATFNAANLAILITAVTSGESLTQ